MRGLAVRPIGLPPIVLHQPERVGSAAGGDPLRPASGRRVFDVHHLTPASLASEEPVYRAQFDSIRRIDRQLHNTA